MTSAHGGTLDICFAVCPTRLIKLVLFPLLGLQLAAHKITHKMSRVYLTF